MVETWLLIYHAHRNRLQSPLSVLPLLFAVPIISSSGLPRSIGDAREREKRRAVIWKIIHAK